MNISWTTFFWLLAAVKAQSCDYYQNVKVSESFVIQSENYPRPYPGGIQCRWIADCPANYNCRLDCPDISLPESESCKLDRLLISKSGDPSLSGADTYCGRGSLTAVSTGQRISIGLISNSSSTGGRFKCNLTTQPAVPNPQCRCGYRKQNRIVGGEETGVNEYPMMVGIADVPTAQIKCGAVIISQFHVLTAAHCLVKQLINETAIIVGEHDVTTGDSPATKAYRVARFDLHPSFTDSNYDYDIAIITVTQAIEFSALVGPACLPFKFRNQNLTKRKVTILGWGTQFIGGPDSKVLMKVDVDVISQTECKYSVTSLTDRQFCTYTPGKDACQDDSGGPLLYTDPDTGLLFNVGIVSYGKFCASRSPGVNTKVAALLDWIVSRTAGVNYCIK